MKHCFKNKTLTSNKNYTESLLYNMSVSLLEHGRIKTTHTKAMALRSYIEKIITAAKKQKNHVLISQLRSNYKAIATSQKYAEKFSQRPGGYTRVMKIAYRKGDNALCSLIEFVDNEPDL